MLEIEHGCFTPLVFSIYGGMGRKGRTFYDRLADLLAEKRKVKKSITTNWIQTKISFALLKEWSDEEKKILNFSYLNTVYEDI